MRRTRASILLLGLFVVIALSALLLFSPRSAARDAAAIGNNVGSFNELSDRFKRLADERGAPYAFDVLRRAEVPAGTDLHLLGHVVGEELYKQQGMGGIAVCTQEFRNACSHTIVIGALNEFGANDATIEKIRDACTKAPGGSGAYTMCFHGLGHGVFAYFSYGIPETVAFCKLLGTTAYGNEEYTQCVGGMIMELVGGGGHDKDAWAEARTKYFPPDDPLAPCNGALIPDEAKSFCYMYLTPRLLEAAGASLGMPDPATFPEAFAFCERIEEQTLRETCWGSFGKEFVPLSAGRDIRAIDELGDEVYERALSWCGRAGKQDAVNACVREALASVFWGGENEPDASFRFCSLADQGGARSACYLELAEAIGRYTEGATRDRLCGRIPAPQQESCGAEL